ncbi:MAG: SDR family oxidoreductase [Thermoplasmata archaeon]
MRKMLVLGADSLIGQCFIRNYNEFKIFGTYHYAPVKVPNIETFTLDLKFSNQIISIIDELRPDLIINTAGRTNIDYCEANPIDAYLINELATKNIVFAAKKNGSFLIQISSDLVFDGFVRASHDEEQETNPISVLGKTKLNAENIIRSSLNDYLIIRTGPIFGWNCITKKRNYVTWILETLKANKEISLVTDQYSNYTSNDFVCSSALKLYKSGLVGIFNISSKDCISQYALGLKIAEIFGLNRQLIKMTSSKKVRMIGHIPKYACLDTSKLKNAIGSDIPDTESMLVMMKDQGCK